MADDSKVINTGAAYAAPTKESKTMRYMQKVMRFTGFVTRMVQGSNSHTFAPRYMKEEWLKGWDEADNIFVEGRRDDLDLNEWIEVYQCRLGLTLGVYDDEE